VLSGAILRLNRSAVPFWLLSGVALGFNRGFAPLMVQRMMGMLLQLHEGVSRVMERRKAPNRESACRRKGRSRRQKMEPGA